MVRCARWFFCGEPPRARVTFFVPPKKVTKESRPDSRALRVPCASRPNRRSPTRLPDAKARTGHPWPVPCGLDPIRAAMLGAADGASTRLACSIARLACASRTREPRNVGWAEVRSPTKQPPCPHCWASCVSPTYQTSQGARRAPSPTQCRTQKNTRFSRVERRFARYWCYTAKLPYISPWVPTAQEASNR